MYFNLQVITNFTLKFIYKKIMYRLRSNTEGLSKSVTWPERRGLHVLNSSERRNKEVTIKQFGG